MLKTVASRGKRSSVGIGGKTDKRWKCDSGVREGPPLCLYAAYIQRVCHAAQVSVCIRFLNLVAYHHGYEGKHCSGQPDQGVASGHFHTFSAQPCAEEAAALVADEYDAKEGGKILGTEESSYQAGGWRHGGAAGETKDDQVSENHRCCLRQQQECQNPDDTVAVKRSHHIFHRKPVGQEAAGQRAGDGGKSIDRKGQGGDGIGDFWPMDKAIGISASATKLRQIMAVLRPVNENACWTRGEKMMLPSPLLALTKPEAMVALSSPILGVIAPTIIPKDTAPEPIGSSSPRKSIRVQPVRQNGMAARPAAMKILPRTSTKVLDLLRARIPQRGCAMPKTS